jgi:hypothetical protein
MARRPKYGKAHKDRREREVRRMRPEQLCCRCGFPLGEPGPRARGPDDPPELDHFDDGFGYQGLSHKSCNRHAGALKGAAVRWGSRPAVPASPEPATGRVW